MVAPGDQTALAERGPDRAHNLLTPVRPALEVLFAPRSIAVFGASDAEGSLGRAVLLHLIESAFGGPVLPISARRQVLGVRAYTSLAEAPEPVDLAVIAAPAVELPGLIDACAAAGVGGAVVLSGGFRETGPPGLELEERLRSTARRGRLRLFGPNGLGLMLPHRGLNASALPMARPGGLAFVSQSGALCTAILDWSQRRGLGFSAFLSAGAMIDVEWGDLIDWLGRDPATKAILLYMESVPCARSLLSAAREAALSKPIVALRAGRTATAARAVASHLGAPAIDDAVLDAALRRCGVHRVDELAELFSLAEVLSKQPRPAGRRLLIVGNGGGPAVLAADRLARAGGELAVLQPDTIAALDRLLPAGWSRTNPVDLLEDADAERFAAAVAQAAGDAGVDGALVVLTPQAAIDPSQAAERIAVQGIGPGKPLLACWMGGERVEGGREILERGGIPALEYPEEAAGAFVAMWRYGDALQALYQTPVPLAGHRSSTIDRTDAAGGWRRACAEGRAELRPDEIEQVLRAYDLVPGADAGRSAADAVELALEARIDHHFGPFLRLSASGPLAEAAGAAAIGLPPLTSTLARIMVEHSPLRVLLDRAGSSELLRLLVQLGGLVIEQGWIRELELRLVWTEHAPPRVAGARLAAGVEPSPPPAIRPYPIQYRRSGRLRDGTPVLIRPIRPEDEPAMARFHRTLSERSVYYRYLRLLKLDQRIAHQRLARLCFIDYDRELALVVERDHQILAVGRWIRAHARPEAEFALLVADPYQGQGLGTELLARLIEVARAEGLERLIGYIHAENRGMQRVCAKLGFELRRESRDPTVIAVLELRPPHK